MTTELLFRADPYLQVADATIFRCMSDTSVVKPFTDPDTGQIDGIMNRTSYLLNSLLTHKSARYGRWTFPRFQNEIGTSNFVCMNERDSLVRIGWRDEKAPADADGRGL